ncbi:hypothetical protein ACLOJK_019588 [Asimina triloba]
MKGITARPFHHAIANSTITPSHPFNIQRVKWGAIETELFERSATHVRFQQIDGLGHRSKGSIWGSCVTEALKDGIFTLEGGNDDADEVDFRAWRFGTDTKAEMEAMDEGRKEGTGEQSRVRRACGRTRALVRGKTNNLCVNDNFALVVWRFWESR